MSKPCRCGGAKNDATYVLEIELDGHSVYSRPAPAQQCEVCGETSILVRDLGRCEHEVAAAAMAAPHLPSGRTIRFARRALGLSIEALAKRLKVDVDTLRMWEMEQLGITENYQRELASILKSLT